MRTAWALLLHLLAPMALVLMRLGIYMLLMPLTTACARSFPLALSPLWQAEELRELPTALGLRHNLIFPQVLLWTPVAVLGTLWSSLAVAFEPSHLSLAQ